ncbi:MAG: L,D-transpeptidase family protein, partial [Candidatus Competibacteraceae bacterium]|nr:L,D-transpeptidase family protein [Candidatus Competibacteraceae bacterium]
PLPPSGSDVIGQVEVVYATKADTLIDIARRHSLGYDEIVHANPGVDRWAPGEGTPIVLPTRYILPDTPREGIVLNIAELRLYYYPSAKEGEPRVVHTYPVSIGRMDWRTPLGLTRVTGKETDPAWRPPASIKAEHAAQGDILPDVVPGGPDNPLGRYALRLALPSYLIHGTNRPYGIGMHVTHGCVRMYPEDIERLFGITPVGASVRIIDQPVKVGRLNGAWLMEAHEPLEEDNIPIKVTMDQVQQAVIAKTGPDMPGIDQAALHAAMEQVSGIPVSIGAQPGSMPLQPVARPTPAAPEIQTPIALDSPATDLESLPVENPSSILVYDDDLQRYDRTAPVEEVQPAYRPGYAPSSYNSSNNQRMPGNAPAVRPPSTYPARGEPPLISSPPVYQPYPSTRQ